VAHDQNVPAEKKTSVWARFAKVITCCVPSGAMKQCGMKDPAVRQAWREKVALCIIIFLISFGVLFITLFLQGLLCPPEAAEAGKLARDLTASQGISLLFNRLFPSSEYVLEYFNVKGNLYKRPTNSKEFTDIVARAGLSPQNSEINLSAFYLDDALVEKTCPNMNSVAATMAPSCKKDNKCIRPAEVFQFKDDKTPPRAIFDWESVKKLPNALVIDGRVLDLSDFVKDTSSKSSTNPVDVELKRFLELRQTKPKMMDATREFLITKEFKQVIPCLAVKYQIGNVSKKTPMCAFSNILFQLLLVIILLIVFVKFFMAIIFSWFLSDEIAKQPKEGKGIMYQPAPVPQPPRPVPPFQEKSIVSEDAIRSARGNPQELHTVMLVTCYTEGEEGLRCTLDSLAATTICDQKKLLFVVADGIVKGGGNAKPTPDIILDIIEEDKAWGEAKPFSYLAVAAGSKRHNMARVHIGFYSKCFR
jgi:chitin synthase